MLDGLRQRMSERYQEVRERDRKWVLQLRVQRLDKYLFLLVTGFIILNFVDVLSTLAALATGPPFYEINPIASGLFRGGFNGFLLALFLKYLPLAPILFVVFLHDSTKRPVEVRTLKFGVLAMLCAADVFYLAVVINNLHNLIVGSVI
ncbi:MAG TPA: DUF5658 family protein [Nitrososphaerales archaeon]|nr:DUF5658 family protein [Nitrososphaerales archaeon]